MQLHNNINYYNKTNSRFYSHNNKFSKPKRLRNHNKTTYNRTKKEKLVNSNFPFSDLLQSFIACKFNLHDH